MNTGGEAAEQIVRMSLEGFEVAAKITGAGAKNIAILLYSILKEEKKTKGKARLTSMLRSGKELKVFTVKSGDLKKFTQEAKKYGVLYCVTVLSFIMIMSVYGRFFKLYIYTAIAPVPLSAFAGEPSQSVGKSFIKSYAAVCLEGAVIVLACIIFSLFASSPPVVNPDAAAVTMVWSYIGELVFNMLVLVGAVKMADRVVREMMGL